MPVRASFIGAYCLQYLGYGGRMILWNVCQYVLGRTIQHPRRPLFAAVRTWNINLQSLSLKYKNMFTLSDIVKSCSSRRGGKGPRKFMPSLLSNALLFVVFQPCNCHVTLQQEQKVLLLFQKLRVFKARLQISCTDLYFVLLLPQKQAMLVRQLEEELRMRMRNPSVEMQQQMEMLFAENEHLTREIAILRETIKVSCN